LIPLSLVAACAWGFCRSRARRSCGRNLRLQYLAGLELNEYQADAIYSQILSYRQAPDAHVSGSPVLMARLKQRRGY
jgi:hypothetical protein